MDPDRDLFACLVEPHRETLVVRPVGELDMESVAEFEKAVEDGSLSGFARLVLDLRGLEFCDSTGLRAILTFASGISEETSFEIVPGPEPVHRAFVITGLADALPFVDAHDAGGNEPGRG